MTLCGGWVTYGGPIGRSAKRRVLVFVEKWPAGLFPSGLEYYPKDSRKPTFELRKPLASAA